MRNGKAIRFEHVLVAYKDDDYVIKFHCCHPGEEVALVTGWLVKFIIRLLCRLYEPNRGRILTTDGIDVRNFPSVRTAVPHGEVILQEGFLLPQGM